MKPILVYTDTGKTSFLLEKQQNFSQSLLWRLQQRYFVEKGVAAWREGEVPQYVTSNPTIAHSYAEIVCAFLQEQRRLAPEHIPSAEPLYLCELGAGSGRFAFHFLTQLMRLFEQRGISPDCFRYILTDFTQNNLDFWRQHPKLQPFFAGHVLDIALFDVTQSEQLALQVSNQTITAGQLQRPLVVIANYVFDTIPQDLYYLNDQRYYQCLVSSFIDKDPATLDTAELLAQLHISYDYQSLDEIPYPEAYLQQLMLDYQQALLNTHLLFPATGLRCLQRLKGLSRQGLVVLSADKGDHRLSSLQSKPLPELVRHGSVSLSVNYHAYKVFCEQSGGISLFPTHHHNSVNVGCLLMLDGAMNYRETQGTYQRYAQDFGPDDYYSIARHNRRYIAEMTVEDILAYLRFSYYDSHQFAFYLPRLMELAPDMDDDERENLINAIENVWEWYFPLGEALDLAYHIACFLYEIDDYARALTYFERSIELYGQHTGTIYNMAMCHQLLEQHEQVKQLLHTVLQYDPENQQARGLLAEYGAAEKKTG